MAESLVSSDDGCLNNNCVDSANSLNALLESYEEMSNKLYVVNLDINRIMDELVRVNFEIDRRNLDNEMKRKDILIDEQPRVLDVKSLDCTSHEPCLTKNRGPCFRCGVQGYFHDKCPLLKNSSKKNASFIQQQLELLN